VELVAGNQALGLAVSAARRLIINADDFGLSEAVNRGIREAHAACTVTSASLLVNTPGFIDAVQAARQMPNLGVGLHLNLTVGPPVSPPDAVPSLCDRRTGKFRGLSHLVARALARRVVAAEVARECTAQLERLSGTGLRITHLDGHQHAHVLPGVWSAVVPAAREAGVTVVRIPLEPVAGIAWRPIAAVGQALLAACYRLAARHVPVPPRHADHFRGFALTGRRDFLQRLLALLDGLEPGVTELMVHPGNPDASLAGWVGYAQGRELELAALTSPAVRERLRRGDIALVHFGAV
jgi:chitin disaccharide deacetylase